MVTKIGEYGIIINEKREFFMLRFSKITEPNETWIFPGGRLDQGESAGLGLAREIQEETGITAEILSPCHVSTWGDGREQRYAVFFVCKAKKDQPVQLSGEHQEYRWFSYDSIDSIDYHNSSFKQAIENAFKLKQKL